MSRHLGLMGISLELIQGYNQEAFTHLGVVEPVALERADCRIGIAAASTCFWVGSYSADSAVSKLKCTDVSVIGHSNFGG